MMTIKITPNDKGNPPGKLADAELQFSANMQSGQECADADVLLDGLKLIGFGIWERRGGNGRNVTFPARQYSVNGERRSFALLRDFRPIGDDGANPQARLRDLILEAYDEHVGQTEAEAHADFASSRRLDGGPSRPDCHD